MHILFIHFPIQSLTVQRRRRLTCHVSWLILSSNRPDIQYPMAKRKNSLVTSKPGDPYLSLVWFSSEKTNVQVHSFSGPEPGKISIPLCASFFTAPKLNMAPLSQHEHMSLYTLPRSLSNSKLQNLALPHKPSNPSSHLPRSVDTPHPMPSFPLAAH